MIDHSKEPGRIDLRAIEEASRPPDADRVITGALARSAEFLGKPQPHVFAALEAYSRPLFAAAAILLVIATGSLAIASGRSGDVEPETVLAEWAQANHVPTNAELLVAFQGYGR